MLLSLAILAEGNVRFVLSANLEDNLQSVSTSLGIAYGNIVSDLTGITKRLLTKCHVVIWAFLKAFCFTHSNPK